MRTVFWRSRKNSHPAMTSTFAGAPVVCCNWCEAHKLRHVRNPGKNGLWNSRRLVQSKKELADQIAKIVSRNGKEGWSFAAPAEIHSAIVELLPPTVRDRIVEHVKSDLVKIEPAKLISRFRSLQQI